MTVAARLKDHDAESVERRARRLSASVGGAEASEIVARAAAEFPGRLALVSSFGAESAVLLDIVAEAAPDTPVLFLDTGKHFAQTLSYRRRLAHALGLRDVRDVHPNTEETARTDPDGALWRRDADACCNLRKVRPLACALEGFDAWITGRKQFHGGERFALPVFEAAAPFVKVNPLVRWTPADVEAHAARRGLPAHPLVAEGYPSIGCWPCTHPAAPGEDPRAGRWRGAAKTECGIHKLGGVNPAAP